MAEAHQRGIELFGQGRYKEAICCFEECLRQAETSEVWNDWATAQFASGRVREASEGLKRALQLDPQNTQAAENLRLLDALAASPQKRSEENQQRVTGKKPIIEEFLQDVQVLPGEDPSLHPTVIEAIRKMRFHSGYFVEKCLERLARLPVEALPKALEALEQKAETDYRLSIVLARYYMQAEDYETALRHLRSACDWNPSDLFAENTLIACSRRQAAKTGGSSAFEGFEAYLAGAFCDVPWHHLEIAWDGNAFLCCPAWLPLRVGNCPGQTLDEIWNSEFALQIRKSILDGSFRFCSKVHCPKIAGRTLPRRASNILGSELTPVSASERSSESPARVSGGPGNLVLAYDRTCNLACPQCRRDFHVARREEQASMDRDYLPLILRAAQDAETLYLNGAGEVFASKHSRHLLSLLKREQLPQLKLLLISNGQLINERAFREFDLYGRVQGIQISVDAARPETYRVVRRGGDFQRLLSNLAFLDDLRSSGGEKFRLELCFVVSSMNFREMSEFVQLGRKFRADSILFTIVRNWGHLSLAEFEKLNIANPCHPEHQEFLRVLESPELSDPIVDCGSVAPYRRHEGCQTVQIRQPHTEDS
jgi:tetratricopeptide (TPR) repeat protein